MARTAGGLWPLEGWVYSRSGTDPDFSPLAAAFGKVDPSGADDLSNSWLNIHPNCLHVLIPWTPAGRSQQQIDAYRKKVQGRARWLADYRQWEKYRLTIPGKTSKTFETFLRHKRAGDEKYRAWMAEYWAANRVARAEKFGILKDTRTASIPVTDEAIQRVPLLRPDGWSREKAERFLQQAHRELLLAVKDQPVGTEAGATYTSDMRLIEHKVGDAATQQILMPRCHEPHILIHNHPSGELFSHTDIAPFVMNENMQAITAVGNSGHVYMLIKTDDYDGFQFLQAYNAVLKQLQDAISVSDMKKYITVMERFLEEVGEYGAKFIKRG